MQCSISYFQDALKFPVVGSGMLVALFVAIKFVPPEYLKFVVNLYCGLIAVGAFVNLLAPMFSIVFGTYYMNRLIINRVGKKTPILGVSNIKYIY